MKPAATFDSYLSLQKWKWEKLEIICLFICCYINRDVLKEDSIKYWQGEGKEGEVVYILSGIVLITSQEEYEPLWLCALV